MGTQRKKQKREKNAKEEAEIIFSVTQLSQDLLGLNGSQRDDDLHF